MSGMGKAMMGTGEAEGEKRAELASEAAINNPLIDDYTLKGAKGLLVNITGGNDITLFEVDEAANKIRAEVDPTADILIGSTIDESMNGKVRVSIVVTGLGGEVVKNKPTLSVVQNRNHGYSKPNLFNNIQSPYSNYSQQAFVQTGYQATQTNAPMASATTNHPSPISGANALDVNTIHETEQNITREVNTNYEELQKNIPLDNYLTENFVNEDENLDVLDTNPIEEQSLLDVEKNIKDANIK
jgi:cell division protein FtsZ